MRARNWLGTGSARIRGIAANAGSTRSLRRKSRFTLMSSTTRLRRSTFRKCRGFSPSYHTADIQYLFPLWHGGPNGIQHALNKKQSELSDTLVAAWTNFAWTGNPNGLGNYPWPRYTNSSVKPAWLIQDLPVLSTLTDPQYGAIRNCDFWDSLSATN